MRISRGPAVLVVAAALTLPVAGLAAAASPEQMGPARPALATALVKKLDTRQFGKVLVTPKYRALYYWTPEKRNPGKILCTGACARAWPPLIVRKGVVVPRKIPGFKGVFATIRRPDGRRQLTYNRLPLYTYAHEDPRQVLCDDVDGWFVVRLR